MWSRSKDGAKEMERRDNFFVKNGAQLVEALIRSCDRKCNPIRNFSYQEMLRATNEFSPNQILCYQKGYPGSFIYKGTIDGSNVTTRKYAAGGDEPNYVRKYFVNDVIMLSQLNHKNILKLIGCCLETDIPILVYEGVEHVLDVAILSWETRLRIAADIAYAVSYIHTALPLPIIHRGIKSSNILLDQNNVAKLSDFSLFISIPLGETDVEDEVHGTYGSAAPEYVKSGKLNEKADVFGFGMFLVELLTGKGLSALFKLARELNVEILDYCKTLMKKKSVIEFIDIAIWEDDEIKGQQIQTVLELALRCIEEEAMVRPTMTIITKELWGIKNIGLL